MKEYQRIVLERGLAELDRAIARRRLRRRAGAVAMVALVLGGVAFLAPRLSAQRDPDANLIVRRPLPACVEVITSDAQLRNELELASACERIGRSEGRIYVVECTREGNHTAP